MIFTLTLFFPLHVLRAHQVISAQSLPKPGNVRFRRAEIIDPFVKVGVAGLDCDTAVFRTKVCVVCVCVCVCVCLWKKEEKMQK